jgi:hypothetical protein
MTLAEWWLPRSRPRSWYGAARGAGPLEARVALTGSRVSDTMQR